MSKDKERKGSFLLRFITTILVFVLVVFALGKIAIILCGVALSSFSYLIYEFLLIFAILAHFIWVKSFSSLSSLNLSIFITVPFIVVVPSTFMPLYKNTPYGVDKIPRTEYNKFLVPHMGDIIRLEDEQWRNTK